MSSDSFDLSGGFDEFDSPPKQPPKFLTLLGIASVLLGILAGSYGVLTRSGSTDSTQFLIGAIGYVFTALIPIVLLQIVRKKHATALQNNKDVPYDIYAGTRQQSLFLKIVAVGLIAAALPIFVFFLPIAEGFAS